MEKALAGPARFIPVQSRRNRGARSFLLGDAIGEGPGGCGGTVFLSKQGIKRREGTKVCWV